jgi:hypothetical protein
MYFMNPLVNRAYRTFKVTFQGNAGFDGVGQFQEADQVTRE